MEPPISPSRRWWPPILGALLAMLLLGCRGGGVDELADAALSARDVPDKWVLADVGEAEGRDLWDALPDLLTSNAEARLFWRVLQDQAGLEGAATILIEAEEPAALPQTVDSDQVLTPLARLLEVQDGLLLPQVRAGDPGAYFAASDLPQPGSVRSRLVRLEGDAYLYSDSAIFTMGPVLAVVTVWYAQEDGPFRPVDELAGEVAQRLRAYLGEG